MQKINSFIPFNKESVFLIVHVLKRQNVFYLPLIFILNIFCIHRLSSTHIGLPSLDKALWITDPRPLPDNDSLFYLDLPAPQFRKTFTSKSKIKNANLLITAAGYYKAYLNGNLIGKNELDPAWTDYSKRIYYSEYDVTTLLANGANCLATVLGNGFYNPLPLKKWGRRNLREDLTVGKPVFIAKLIITYLNGKTETIVSDTSWKYTYGPIIKNDVYLGVVYDAKKELPHWNKAEYNDRSWQHAVIGNHPGGLLQKAFFPAVQVTSEIKALQITSPENEIYIVDMGVNFTGTYKIKLKGAPGDTIILRFGERIYSDGKLNPMTTVAGQIKRKGVGGPGAPDIAWQTDSYIVGNNTDSWFTPDFTYHTYRYLEIKGLKYKPALQDVIGLFIHSNVESNNSFTCSSSLLNSIQEITRRTFQANIVSVQSDCAAREKFGYGGDLNATSESFIYNYDMQSFYKKTLYDWVDAMKDSSFIDTAPFTGIEYCGISWESAFITTQYYLYLYYHDTAIIHELYDLDKKWMDKASRIHPGFLVQEGLSDHESLVPVPVELTGTAHYLQCAQIMRQFASIMQDDLYEKKYTLLADTLKKVLVSEFWRKPLVKQINKQTLFSTLLYHGVIPENEINAAKDSLVKALRNGPAGHFNTGIHGTKYMLESISDLIDPDTVFTVVNSTVYPGWGHMIAHGATTIWETWKESDNTYSNCHPMFGTVTEWFYRWLAGIRPDPAHPGFDKFIIGPSVPDSLEFVTCSYTSPLGKIISNWKKLSDGKIQYEISIPAKSKAKIILPISPADKVLITIENTINKKREVMTKREFELMGGEWIIIVSQNE